MRLQKWVAIGVVAALVAWAFSPVAPAAAWSIGNTTLYLAKHKKDDVLTVTPPKTKGARNVESTKIDPNSPGFTSYRELGTWNSDPLAEPSRIIDVGVVNLWLKIHDADGQQQANVQVLVEALKNGNVAVAARSGCIALQRDSVSKIISLPTPLNGIDLAIGDRFGVRVSVQDGSAVPGCAGGVKSYKVRLDYDGGATPSKITFEVGTLTGATGGLIVVGLPSFVDAFGTLYVAPETMITVPISIATTLVSCTITLTSVSVPPVIDPVTLGCAQGPNEFVLGGLPFGLYDIRAAVEVILSTGVHEVRSDLVEVMLVATVPSS